MPVENVWGLALNNSLTKAPAYEGTRGFFTIEGDRIAAYDLIEGTQQWLVTAHPEMAPVAGDGLVFIREADRLLALRSSDGAIAWQLPIADKLAVHPVWDNGWLIIALATGEVRAAGHRRTPHLDARSEIAGARGAGARRGSRLRPHHRQPHRRAPRRQRRADLGAASRRRAQRDPRARRSPLCRIAGQLLLLRDGGRRPGRLALADGRRRRSANRSPTSRYVYFVSLDNVLRAMNLVTGGQQWMRPLPMRPAWGAVRAGSTIVVAGLPPPLRAFNIKDGIAAGTLTGVATQAPEASPPGRPRPPTHRRRRRRRRSSRFLAVPKWPRRLTCWSGRSPRHRCC